VGLHFDMSAYIFELHKSVDFNQSNPRSLSAEIDSVS